jgi:site-specific DNA-adenine methylase
MQYQGGKWRMRKDISNILKMFYNDTPDKFTQYIEPFVGGASVLSEVCKWFPKT